LQGDSDKCKTFYAVNLARFLIATDWLFAGFTGRMGVVNIARASLELTLKKVFSPELKNRTSTAYKDMKRGVVSAVSTTIVVVLLSMKSKKNIQLVRIVYNHGTTE